jgi:hypothetical protein
MEEEEAAVNKREGRDNAGGTMYYSYDIVMKEQI